MFKFVHNVQIMAGNLPVKLTTNMVFPVSLQDEHYAPLLAFLRQSRIAFAISSDTSVLTSAIQEFYLNLHRVIDNDVTILRSSVRGQQVDITVTEIRRILQL